MNKIKDTNNYNKNNMNNNKKKNVISLAVKLSSIREPKNRMPWLRKVLLEDSLKLYKEYNWIIWDNFSKHIIILSMKNLRENLFTN